MNPVISSSKNALIKKCIGLEKKKNRLESKLFLIEGIRETSLALQENWDIDVILYPDGILDVSTLGKHPEYPIRHPQLQAVDPTVLDKLTYRKGIENVLAIARQKDTGLQELQLEDKPLILVLQALEKPGNIGAILRTADAAGIQNVILADPLADRYNPNMIRSSLGAAFCLNIAEAKSEEVYQFCREKNITMHATYLEGATAHYDTDFSSASAIIMGSEAYGIDDFWKKNSDTFVKIPMYGHVDSMNVSTSCAVVVFEAIRQRTQKQKI